MHSFMATLQLSTIARIGTPTRTLSSLSSHGNILGGSSICPNAEETFRTWHTTANLMMSGGKDENIGEQQMHAKLRNHFHDAVKFYPPTYHNNWTGADETLVLLRCVSEVFGDSFRYKRQWLSDNGREWCLEFSAEIDGDEKKKLTLEGVDLVSLDEEGKIVEFKVLARPPNAVAALKKKMMAKVPIPMAALKAKQALGLQ